MKVGKCVLRKIETNESVLERPSSSSGWQRAANDDSNLQNLNLIPIEKIIFD